MALYNILINKGDISVAVIKPQTLREWIVLVWRTLKYPGKVGFVMGMKSSYLSALKSTAMEDKCK